MSKFVELKRAVDEIAHRQKELASYVALHGRRLHDMLKVRYTADAKYWLDVPRAEREMRVEHSVDLDMQWMIANADDIVRALEPFRTDLPRSE